MGGDEKALFAFPIFLIISLMTAPILRQHWCPNSIAPITSSSEACCAPASTITMPPSVPATMMFNLDSRASVYDGLATYFPFTRPTRTPPRTWWNGISEMAKAVPAPNTASGAGSCSGSADSTMAIICVSFKNPSGNKGRMGRSINRLVRISFSVGRPSRLMKPPGNFPAAYVYSR